jgi:hypothetical protein
VSDDAFVQIKVTPLSENPFQTEPAMRGLKVSTVYFPSSGMYQTMCLGPYPMTGLQMMRYRSRVQRIVTGYERLAPTGSTEHTSREEALAYHEAYVQELRQDGWV